MHLPVEGYMAILGALLAGSATLSPLRRRRRFASACSSACLPDGAYQGLRRRVVFRPALINRFIFISGD